MNDSGNIVDYEIYAGGDDIMSGDVMSFSSKKPYTKALSKTQMESLKAELRSMRVYDGMVQTSTSNQASEILNEMRRTQPSSANGAPTGSVGSSVGTPSGNTPAERSSNRFGTRIGQQ